MMKIGGIRSPNVGPAHPDSSLSTEGFPTGLGQPFLVFQLGEDLLLFLGGRPQEFAREMAGFLVRPMGDCRYHDVLQSFCMCHDAGWMVRAF